MCPVYAQRMYAVAQRREGNRVSHPLSIVPMCVLVRNCLRDVRKIFDGLRTTLRLCTFARTWQRYVGNGYISDAAFESVAGRQSGVSGRNRAKPRLARP